MQQQYFMEEHYQNNNELQILEESSHEQLEDEEQNMIQEKKKLEQFYQQIMKDIENQKYQFSQEAMQLEFPEYDENQDYEGLHKSILNENYQIMDNMKKYIYELTNLQICILITNEKIEESERKIAQISAENFENNSFKKPKYRRKNNELNKKFKCPYRNCEKSYGSDVSLNLHIKIKHNGGSKIQRQIYAKKILENKRIDFNLDLPPGYLNNFQQQINYKKKSNVIEDNLINTQNINNVNSDSIYFDK